MLAGRGRPRSEFGAPLNGPIVFASNVDAEDSCKPVLVRACAAEVVDSLYVSRKSRHAALITKLTRAEVADAFASVTAEAFNLPADDVPAPQGERLVALMNDWLATRNWRFAYVRDPQTFAWPGSWIALATDERSPSGWRICCCISPSFTASKIPRAF